MIGLSHGEVSAAFDRVLRNDVLAAPGLAMRLALVVKSHAERGGWSDDEAAAMLIGATAMHQALIGDAAA